VTRVITGQTFTLAYNAENQLVTVTGPSMSAAFTYDGDGRQVKSIINGVTTLFVGAHYEVQGTTITKYYFAGSQRIAMRANGTLTYLLGDHLGSTSIVTNASGAKISEQRYKPWGETRFTSGTLPTKYQYTGQRSEMDSLGLYFYNARWYDPALGRFAQADSLIFGAGSSQAWDRYAYAMNNTLRYIDPSGHEPHGPGSCYGEGDPNCPAPATTPTPTMQNTPTPLCTGGPTNGCATATAASAIQATAQSLCSNATCPTSTPTPSPVTISAPSQPLYWGGAVIVGGGYGGNYPHGNFNSVNYEAIIGTQEQGGGLYSSVSQSDSTMLGGGDSAQVYLGYMIDYDSPEEYTGHSNSAGLTFSVGPVGGVVGAIWGDSPDSPKGAFAGYAPGAELAGWYSSSYTSLIFSWP
jgi:RHS repeat-associated protein